MTMSLNWTLWRFTEHYRQQNFRENIEKEKLEINNIKSQLVWKTFEEIKQIVKNIWDHTNPEWLIKKLKKFDKFEDTKNLLAKAIKNSTFSVEKILNISKK